MPLQKALRRLDMNVAGGDNPVDPVGFCRAASEEESTPWQNPPGWTAVSRRTVLKGMAGAAGLVSIPAIIAACSSSRRRRAPRRLRPRRLRPASRRRPSTAPSVATGSRHVRVELLEQGHRHQGHAGRGRRVHRQDRHRRQGQHGRPQHVPGPDQPVPPGHAGRRLHVVRRLPDALLRGAGPGDATSRRCGPRSGRTSATRSRRRRPATTASSTSSRSTTTRGSSSTARASSPRRATPSRRRGPTSRPSATR